MRRHILILGNLLLAFGVLLSLSGLGLLGLARGGDAVRWLAAGLLVSGIPYQAAGLGVRRIGSAGRILGIIVSVLALPLLPVGTLLGSYGLWVLLSAEGEIIFRSESYQAPQYQAPVAPVRVRARPFQIALTGLLALIGIALFAAGLLVFSRLELGARWLPKAIRDPLVETGAKLPVPLSPPAPEPTGAQPSHGLYTFTDDDGVMHIVDDLEKVPARYRKAARRAP